MPDLLSCLGLVVRAPTMAVISGLSGFRAHWTFPTTRSHIVSDMHNASTLPMRCLDLDPGLFRQSTVLSILTIKQHFPTLVAETLVLAKTHGYVEKIEHELEEELQRDEREPDSRYLTKGGVWRGGGVVNFYVDN
ncbi:hypothetical protein RRG08_009197 [Elysia crispata]|uniref:Uncharacterized protein n=1 Tax=Elysia crispata TaxID=231223 RepID=A0AAE0Z8C3_9GAST|nr:hypothetical protein RRG08_009197 [Elysia crispata]